MKTISGEQLRILVAAAQGRLSFDSLAYRYKIEGEPPPDQRERKKLQQRGLLSRPGPSNPRILTELGREAIASWTVTKDGVPPRKKPAPTLFEDSGGGE